MTSTAAVKHRFLSHIAHRTFKTKPQLGLEVVKQAREPGLAYGWVGADGLYGNNPELLYGLDDLNETFMIDVY